MADNHEALADPGRHEAGLFTRWARSSHPLPTTQAQGAGIQASPEDGAAERVE